MDKFIGKLIGGRYQIIEVVGVGGMAVVYRARDTILGRDVALKILKKEYAADPDIRKRFSIESRAVAKLSHNNIVSVFDVGSEDGTDYIVMELIEGITLKHYLQKKGHLSWQEAVFFAEQVSRALMHAHSRGIIHQDIKPQNVIILRDGTAKLTDFGIASFAAAQETRVVQEAIGSVHYISPEQAKGSKIDYRTDLYSLGVMLYEMLTGRLPFEGETALQVVMQHINEVPPVPSSLMPGIPQGLDDIVMHAMSANISRRYESAEQMYEDMERVRNDPETRFHYVASEDNSGETQIIGADIQRAARRASAESEPVSTGEAAPAAAPRPRTRTTYREREPEPQSFFEKLSEKPAMAAGIAVAVVAVVSLLVVGILIFTGGSHGEKLPVPDLLGRTIDEVMADTDITDNFTIKEASKREESDRPEGEIIDQDPLSDGSRTILKGSVITVTVSAGGDNVKDTYKVVDFSDKTIDYVKTALAAHDILCEFEEEYSDEVEEGKVIRTDPEAGTEIERGSTLTVYVSKGKKPEDEKIAVPGLLGMTKDKAEKALTEKGLSIGSVNEVESTAEAGSVVWQSQDAGAEVAKGTTVNIQISKGKSDSGNNGQNTGNTGNTTGNNGDNGNNGDDTGDTPTLGSATVPVALPDNTDVAHVVVYVDGVIQYDDTRSTSEGSIAVPVTGSAGEHEVTVSVDGSSYSQTYTFN